MDNRIIGIFISVITIYIAIALYDSPVSIFEKDRYVF